MDLQEFEQQLQSHVHPVIVDVWAPWCLPCRFTKPILESLAREYADRVDLWMINADEHPQLLGELGISGIPTVLATYEGEIVKRIPGAQSRENYRVMFEALANPGKSAASMSAFDRLIRLSAGIFLFMVGLSIGAPGLMFMGGIVAFLGIYDRCPVWRAITGRLRRRMT